MDACDRPWSADEFPPVAEWLDSQHDVLSQMQIPRDAKFFIPLFSNNGMVLTAIPEHHSAMRAIARTFSIRANRALSEKRWSDAWDDISHIKQLGQLCGQGPSFYDTLVGVAIKGIACRTARNFVMFADESVDWEQFQNSWLIEPTCQHDERINIYDRAFWLDFI